MSAPAHEDAVILLETYELGSTAEQSQAWRFVFGDDFIEGYEGFVKEYSPATNKYNFFSPTWHGSRCWALFGSTSSSARR